MHGKELSRVWQSSAGSLAQRVHFFDMNLSIHAVQYLPILFETASHHFCRPLFMGLFRQIAFATWPQPTLPVGIPMRAVVAELVDAQR
ncbi:MAG: hypothetical protein WCC66_08375 [Rhizobiaceae bacterium]